MARLDERERRVIRLRFGFDGGEGSRTLEEVGREIGTTRERARQIQEAAFGKMRGGQTIKGDLMVGK